ncbi:hypothetical protein NE237_016790 [Protea cynaroides]|uniref:Uncharacterized protein n=1 Tax=Protea cynaroides TaxID=273540 RepID=A0A9Q0HE73_9MAGN|nr:hypothetical protein NE237_016790 [Protea cynaroides]
MVVENIAIAGATEILKKLSSYPEQEIILICGVKKEFKKLKKTSLMLLGVLRDAEMRQEKNELISCWLKRLKDVAYEVDDVLDEFSFEDIRRKMEIQNSKMKKVSDFFSSNNQIAFRSKMAHKIKNINETMDDIRKDMEIFKFVVGDINVYFKNDLDRKTYPSIDYSETFGREEEKSMLIDLLIDSNNEESLSVIPIRGMGGLGKTTLAQIVYNNESIVAHFDKQMWICVSDNFEIERLKKEMIESFTGVKSNLSNPGAIQCKLEENLPGKKFLLVLDDVWNEDHEKWHNLKASLIIGAKGSKIVVTTRSSKVAGIMGTVPTIILTGLSENESWSLFKIRTFRIGGATENSNTLRIGRRLVEKCRGVPLAIKSLSALMYSKRSDREWVSFQDNNADTWDLRVENGIIPVLKLSYDHFSPPLKQCFAYCSIFPKDYIISKKMLIQLWMAEGLLQSSNDNMLMEDVGDEYFSSLVWSSFFQDVEEDSYGEVTTCKMHDLVHDLTKSIIGNECMIVHDFDKVEPKEETRYLSLIGGMETTPKTFFTMKKVRTHLCLDRTYRPFSSYHVSKHMFLSLRSLRVLHLVNAGIKSLPSCIEKLKHLRYLDLSGNSFAIFSESITNLYNLQTLKMVNIIRELDDYWTFPKGMTKMINLRHLEVDCGLKLLKGIGQLTNLQTLSHFWVEEGTEADAGIEELGDLQLGGALTLVNVNCLSNNASAANLKEKPRLRKLHLIFKEDCKEPLRQCSMVSKNGFDVENKLLESLQPHPNLIDLRIAQFQGTRLPNWIDGSSYLSSLQELNLYQCKNMMSLDLTGLCSLRWLDIDWCSISSLGLLKGLTNLKYIRVSDCNNLNSLRVPKEDNMPDLISLERLEINRCSGLATLPDGFFSLLRSLNFFSINDCSILRNLPESIGNLSSLRELYIEDCPSLAALPESFENLSSLRILEIKGLKGLIALPESFKTLSSLPSLRIDNNHDLIVLPETLGYLSSLERLVIESCPALTSLPDSLQELKSLKNLYLRELESLTKLPEGLGNLSSLENLNIYRCPALTSSPDSLQELRSLKILYLGGLESLTKLPEGLGNLSSLENLNIYRCPALTSSPDSLQELRSLKILYLGELESLTKLPEGLGNLSSLENLNIYRCPALTSLPDSLQELRSLKILYLGELESLTKLPEGLGNLSSLESLEIIECPALTSLPDSLQELRSLKLLYLGWFESLTKLPEGLGNLSSLEKLNIYNCPALTTLPDSLQELRSLKTLYINDLESFTKLPEGLGNLSSLEKLNIYSCPVLTTLPDSLQELRSLQYLNINGFESLTKLPEGLGNLSSLEELFIWNCPVLTSLPDSLQELRSLKDLHISDLKSLTKLPEGLGNLSSLEELFIWNCPVLTSLSDSLQELRSLKAPVGFETMRLYKQLFIGWLGMLIHRSL